MILSSFFSSSILLYYIPELSSENCYTPSFPQFHFASKIQHTAYPNQILIGDDVYSRLHPNIQKQFEQVVWTQTKWKYHDRETGKLYPVYSYVG